MELILKIALFLLGTISASFIGLVASRLYTGASIVRGRSRCDACSVPLHPLGLVPIVSWLLSAGRCLACRGKVSPLSTLAELTLGLLFVLAYIKLGLGLPLITLLVAITLIVGIVLYDLAHSIIPPVFSVLFAITTLLFAVLTSANTDALTVTVCTALLLGSLLAIIHLASGGRAMGFADAPFTFGLSLLVAPLAVSGFIFSFWVGGVIGTVLLVRRAGGSKINSEVPFAPFLACGYLLAYFTSCSAFNLTASLLAALGL